MLDDIVLDDLALAQCANANAPKFFDMNENVFAAVLWLNEAVALGHIERFDEALWHGSPAGL
jgi:hypothetical protein